MRRGATDEGCRGACERPAALALVDGEHYPPVVRAALDRLAADHHFVAALFLGGAEKLRAADGSPGPTSGGPGATPEGPAEAAGSRGLAAAARERLTEELGLPVLFLSDLAGDAGRRGASPESVLPAALLEALRRSGAAEIVDLSDEPVVGYRERFLLVSAAAAAGVAYVGADFVLRPQPLAELARRPLWPS